LQFSLTWILFTAHSHFMCSAYTASNFASSASRSSTKAFFTSPLYGGGEKEKRKKEEEEEEKKKHFDLDDDALDDVLVAY